jgi:hypothetical protein
MIWNQTRRVISAKEGLINMTTGLCQWCVIPTNRCNSILRMKLEGNSTSPSPCTLTTEQDLLQRILRFVGLQSSLECQIGSIEVLRYLSGPPHHQLDIRPWLMALSCTRVRQVRVALHARRFDPA